MTRRVGIELEFGTLPPKRAAAFVQEIFGGRIAAHGTHAFRVEVPVLGSFKVELDSRYVDHGEAGTTLEKAGRVLMGEIGGLIIPTEITSPPLPVAAFGRFEELIARLRMAGAAATGDALVYAFALHLNPEVEDTSPPAILAMLRAFALGYSWLHDEIDVDITRELAGYAEPYPDGYVRLIAALDYDPDLDRLAADYLRFNPSRSRALDLLPLLAHLQPDQVRRALPPGEKLSARPAFHYRLPNTALDDPAWGLAAEWRRWTVIERLAADRALLADLQRVFIEGDLPSTSPAWRNRSAAWIERCRPDR